MPLRYVEPVDVSADVETLIVLGRTERLRDDAVYARLPEGARAAWTTLLDSLRPGDAGAATTTWLGSGDIRRLGVGALPDRCSRHNAPGRPDAVHTLVAKLMPRKGPVGILIALDDAAPALAAGVAVARALPLYSRKRAAEERDAREVRVALLAGGQPLAPPAALAATAQAVRLAARLVDMPTAELTTTAFVDEAREVARRLDCSVQVIAGDELLAHGLGGIHAVGRAAVEPPALVVLTFEPPEPRRTVALVGKGIVYDTGGLSIKPRTGMPGMKRDMGGAAAVLGAFEAAVRRGVPDRVHALFCLAENAVGPRSFRPDDILQMYSGKTVEINNTDAEGRLVLADGVAYAAKDLQADVIMDAATLTGAQLTSTGARHAAIVSNDEAWEHAAIRAGQATGDLVHPLPYCPEFFRKEFRSKVADLKNSVKNRANAQTSCAAQFVAEHLGEFDGPWLHIDLAGPSRCEERGTGFGVALMSELLVHGPA